ncbi:hypothetical protein EDF57_11453 [Novosphingobium sp. PhB55]|nr:hypothetical protein EDF57_11453 [Novosphingobium sp. PhB55]
MSKDDARFAARPGALRVASPSGPSALNRSTQSRTICSVTPATLPLRSGSRRPVSAHCQQPPNLIDITASPRKPT